MRWASTNGADEKLVWDTGEKDRRKCTTACRWVDIIKMDLREIGWKSMDCIHLASDMGHWAILLKAYLKAVKLYSFMW
jgi:hypothetical protein